MNRLIFDKSAVVEMSHIACVRILRVEKVVQRHAIVQHGHGSRRADEINRSVRNIFASCPRIIRNVYAQDIRRPVRHALCRLRNLSRCGHEAHDHLAILLPDAYRRRRRIARAKASVAAVMRLDVVRSGGK